MSAWHLLWMHVTGLGILALLLLTPFAWHYAVSYNAVDRFKNKRLYWWLFRQHYARDGLPCTLSAWSHGEMVEVPGLGLTCRRCGWARKAVT